MGHSEILLYLSTKLTIEAEDTKTIRARISVHVQNQRGDPVFLVFRFAMFANLLSFQAGSQFPIVPGIYYMKFAEQI